LITAAEIFWIGVRRDEWAVTSTEEEIEQLPGRFSQG
jgi:hypothetical protein